MIRLAYLPLHGSRRSFRRPLKVANSMKICVLGAGSLGSAIGGTLAESGREVWLINRSRAHVEAVRRDGLRMRDGNAVRAVQVKAAVDCADVGPVDLVIVLVKSYDTRAAIAGATSILGPDTVVLSLQNGVGHEDILAEYVGRERVLAGKTYVGGQVLEPGLIIAGTRGKDTIMGELDGTVTPRVRRVADAFNGAGLRTVISTNIMGTIWDKLLVNVATGALSGISGLAYGDLYQVPALRECAMAAVAEAMAVARASGVTLSFTDPEQPWRRAGEGLPADFKASILQSLERGMPTEIDYINGAVVATGARLGIPTPVNAALVACIKGIERRLVRPASARSDGSPPAPAAAGAAGSEPGDGKPTLTPIGVAFTPGRQA
jgi:2-dehydropantoate 2-reductase